MVKKTLIGAALVALLAAPALVSAQVPGALYTTDESCQGVNLNIYGDKDDVYISGGPTKKQPVTHLPDGEYYVKVTEPNGELLGTSYPNKPFVVAGGEVQGCYQLSNILTWPDLETAGYMDTTNPGGVYKVWISQESDEDSDFPNHTSKTDNFKVKAGAPEMYQLGVIKFYDANVNGEFDNGEVELEGWMVRILEENENGLDIDRETPFQILLDAGTYIVSEYMPSEPYWVPTTATSETVTLPPNAYVEFGNVCLGAGGGKTLGFWSNKNGEKIFLGADSGAASFAALNALGLVDANGDVMEFTNYAQFRTWLLGANANNMAYMLSAQLAAMELNVLWGLVDELALVYAPGILGGDVKFITIEELIDAAIEALEGPNPNRERQELIKNALDKANNNYIFVQPEPCTFSFGE